MSLDSKEYHQLHLDHCIVKNAQVLGFANSLLVHEFILLCVKDKN